MSLCPPPVSRFLPSFTRPYTHPDGGPDGGLGWGIMRYMGLVEIAAILIFVALVVFAVWWLVTSFRR